MQGEIASSDVEAAVSYSENLAMLIKKGGYTKYFQCRWKAF